MMPHIIPGGRQRASSDGDVLEDEEDTLNASGVLDRLTEAHRNVSRSAILSTTDDSDDSRSYTETNKTNTHTNKKKGLRAKLSFKSVKKAVSRALQKDSVFGSASSLNKEEMPAPVRTSSAAGVWTPTLRRRGRDDDSERTDGSHHEHRSGRDAGDGPGIDSVSRPLITDPGVMIAKWERTPGNVGIFNHGNTCFMNAVLQCLSHTDSFSEYFITDLYKDDLKNTRNVAKKIGSKGSKGDVTEQLGMLLKSLWTEKYNSETSIDFKAIVGKYNIQYKGNSQHDAQEFLLWLLDRVHEDLMLPSSQAKKKNKQTKNVVGPTRSLSDQELAEAAESGLNSSFVSRLFQALHRSSLTCPHCNRHSNTFDPYLCVSLPLPQKCLRPVYVTVVPLHEDPRAVRIGLSLNTYDTVRELRDALEAETEIPANELVLCHLASDGFYATYSNEQPLSDVPESNNIYAIQMYSSNSESAGQQREYETPTVQILLLHVETGLRAPERFCSPEVIRISREANMRTLQAEILRGLGGAVKREVSQQRLRSLFKLRIVDGSSRKTYLPEDVEMPLYAQTVDRVLSMFGEEFGPEHLKLIAEWDPSVKELIIEDGAEQVLEHASVKQVRAQTTEPVRVSLNECFQLYTQEEKLAGDDAWLCPHCKKPQKGATKTLGLWSVPEVLVLHLKRFKQVGMRRNKLNMLVNFPVEDLDMASHVVQQGIQGQGRDDMTYDLIGVANHYGNMAGGHYTAFCKNTVDGVWHEFDDQHVNPLVGDQVVTSAAYILFYQRRSLTKLINQRLHTGNHWVFTLEPQDKSSSPQRRGSPVKRGEGYNGESHRSPTHTFITRPPSKEWNGPSSPTRRPTSRPLTPQPQRRQVSFEIDNYETSPTVIKPKPLFRPTRPTLSRQLSDAQVRAKRQLAQDPGMADDHQRQDLALDGEYGRSPPSYHPQPLQVHLPPRSSTHAADVMGTDVPRAHSADILQPQKVQLPLDSRRDDGRVSQPRATTDAKGTNFARPSSHLASPKGTDVTWGSSQSSRNTSSASYHSPQSQPPSVDVRVVDSPSFRPYQQDPQGVRSIPPQPTTSIPPRSGRPWQYESQSSQSSRDTQSSQDSHSPKQDLPTKIPVPLGKEACKVSYPGEPEAFDWRQPEVNTGAELTVRHSPSSTANSTRPQSTARAVGSSKPPIPPKTFAGKKVDGTRGAGSSSSGTSIMLRPVPTTSPSLTSPPSPAPKDTIRDLQHRSNQRDLQQPSEALTAQVALASLAERRREEQLREMQRENKPPERELLDEKRLSRGRQAEQTKPREEFIQISGDQYERRRRSQHLDHQKFATIARGNRDARSEPRDVLTPALVPRSATDYSLQSSHRSYSPSRPHQAQRSLVPVTHFSPKSDRTSFSSGSEGYPRAEWDVLSAERDSVKSAPLYSTQDHSSSERGGARRQIYRGPLFQHHRPKKSKEPEAPSLRESSV